ncbi:gliding motility-associated C-terminal domain-containing protein [Flavihumibacter sp. UBA7668]|uniref:T9SS type B sorting domain-containing protein n=1 Tax=Flavihumibacter sp. UBA7668 TaxID=1946542 RepID=UPI0025BF8C02|nr:gliding motility-associated C-terminal domain-containing protein [Flavihumibacter sp. UBA7668]
MKYLVPLCVLICSCISSYCQQPILDWAGTFEYRSHAYHGGDNGRAIAVDQIGNVYSTGLFKGPVDFDPGPGELVITAGNSIMSQRGIYVTKQSSTGEIIWAGQFPLSIEFSQVNIVVDKMGNTYISSYLNEVADMDPGIGEYLATPIGTRDVFVVKLNPTGDLVWIKQFGGKEYDTVCDPNSLTIDSEGNLIIIGKFSKTIDFDPGLEEFNLRAERTMIGFIVKLNSNGEFIWARKIAEDNPAKNSYIEANDIDADENGNILLAGVYSGECDFDTGKDSSIMRTGGWGEIFVLLLDPNGNCIWVRSFGNNSNYQRLYSHGVSFDKKNNIYIAGAFGGTQDFDPGPNSKLLVSNSPSAAYILKLSKSGEFLWVKQLGNQLLNAAHDIGVDPENNVYSCGIFSGTINFDPGITDYTLQNLNNEGLVIRYSEDGDFGFLTRFEKISESGGLFLRKMVVGSNRALYFTGSVNGAVDADPGPNEYKIHGGGSSMPYVIKLAPCPGNTYSTLSVNTCNQFKLGNHTFDSSGSYTVSIPNLKGCDSIINLDLTIIKNKITQRIEICEGDQFYAAGKFQTTSGSYVDSLESLNGCDSILTTELIVRSKPVPTLGPDRDLCEGVSIIINPGIFVTYEWQNGDNSKEQIITKPGLYWVNVTDINNCSASDSLNIVSIRQNPINFLPSSDTICKGNTKLLAPSKPFIKYYWSTGTVTNNITINSAGTYFLEVEDNNGCKGIESIKIIEKDCLKGVYIPTAFSPNGDGKNDFFRAIVYGKLRKFSLTVFDRYGSIVFHTIEPNNAWNGVINGLAPTASNYVWQCSYEFENELPSHKKGSLILIK